MKIGILGGTGQVGTVVRQKLIASFPQAEIISFSRSGGKDANMRAFDVFNGDWSTIGQFDILINVVGIIEEKNGLTFQNTHIGLPQKLIQNRSAIGNPKIIHLSALGADVSSPSRYASTKAVGDDILQKEENTVVLRPSFVCTPGTAIVQKVKMLHTMSKWQLGFLPIPAHFLTAKFQPVHGDDVAEAMVQIIKKDIRTGIINATGLEQFVLEDWIKIVGKGKIRIIRIPKWIIDFPFRMIIKIFPQIMNTDQYLLLGKDNIADTQDLESVLERKVKSTQSFWEEELSQ